MSQLASGPEKRAFFQRLADAHRCREWLRPIFLYVVKAKRPFIDAVPPSRVGI